MYTLRQKCFKKKRRRKNGNKKTTSRHAKAQFSGVAKMTARRVESSCKYYFNDICVSRNTFLGCINCSSHFLLNNSTLVVNKIAKFIFFVLLHLTKKHVHTFSVYITSTQTVKMVSFLWSKVTSGIRKVVRQYYVLKLKHIFSLLSVNLLYIL